MNCRSLKLTIEKNHVVHRQLHDSTFCVCRVKKHFQHMPGTKSLVPIKYKSKKNTLRRNLEPVTLKLCLEPNCRSLKSRIYRITLCINNSTFWVCQVQKHFQHIPGTESLVPIKHKLKRNHSTRKVRTSHSNSALDFAKYRSDKPQ